jgi:hypothetical protein
VSDQTTALTTGPVFITGSPRSGTSIFSLGLRNATGITSFAEGHLLDLYGKLSTSVDRHYQMFAGPAGDSRHALGNVAAADVKLALARTMLDLSDKVHGGPTWLDKTAGTEMMEFLRVLTRLDRPFITFFLFRRPLENVYSRLRKFPKHDIAYHAADWASIMRHWRETRDMLKPGSWVEVEHKDIVDHPDRVADSVARVMRLSPGQRNRLIHIFTNRRPQVLASETVGRTLTIEETGWDPGQQTVFRQKVDEEMRRWGFTYDERYRVPA